MDNRFHRLINAVCFRQRIQQTLDDAAWGLLLAALVVLISPILAGAMLMVSVIIGMISPLRRAGSMANGSAANSSARLIDEHYHLKDRILTSAALLRLTNRTPMQQLQIEDTAKYLAIIQPRAVYPIRLPKMCWIVLLVFPLNVFATTVGHRFFSQATDNTEVVLLTLAEENVALLEKIVTRTEELAQEHAKEEALQELATRMETLRERFVPETLSVRESLITFSEMDDAFQATLDSLRLETMERSLLELATVLELADLTLPIGRALERGEFDLAAMELRELCADMLELLTEPELNAMAEQMQAIADSAEERNQSQLQEAAQNLANALESGDGELAKSATDALADEIERHSVRQEIGKDILHQQMMLALMMAEGSGGPGGMDGGMGIGESDAFDTWGLGSAGDPLTGEGTTDFEADRHLAVLSGILGEEGEVEMEMAQAQEPTDVQSVLQFREQFLHYQRISESVLDSEPIPLGQRQIIRRYFEAIRPVE